MTNWQQVARATLKLNNIQSNAINMTSRNNHLILLTGGTGFVGNHTAKALLDSGCRVRCLVRPTSDRSRMPDSIEFVEGDVTDHASLTHAVAGCWGVVHAGGLVKANDKQDFYRVNRDGTANLVRAARDTDVKRFVLCSSQAAGGPSVDHRRQASDLPAPVTEYGKSKLAGEKVLQTEAGDMWHCIIRPPAVYGPYDVAFLSLVRGIKYHVKLGIGSRNNKYAIIHGEDLAQALMLGLSVDCPSGMVWYATDGVDHTTEELGTVVEIAMNRKAVWITIPKAVAIAIAGLNEMLSKLRGSPALLSREKINELTQTAWTCDDKPFRDITGFKEKYNLFDGMVQTVKWYKDQGWI